MGIWLLFVAVTVIAALAILLLVIEIADWRERRRYERELGDAEELVSRSQQTYGNVERIDREPAGFPSMFEETDP